VISVDRVVRSQPGEVWKVLADGWLYPLWVVGASRMREVDRGFPEPGTCLHHSVGSWPALVDDTTTVEEAEPSRRLRLRARAWPAGEAHVEIDLAPDSGGTRVTLTEDAVSGPGTLVPQLVRAPLLRWRNTESLRRLALLVENRPGS
jgi:uncharacterized protein YndB with AHSA1/START domain